jgi:drug/metabolite transporter (DMT)-like permease
MPIIWVFLLVVSIWSTTPLAIQWSTLGASASFAVASRMFLGLLICVVVLGLTRRTFCRSRVALANYLYAGLGIFVTMSLVYYAAQRIPSGLISVVFGLTPIVTGVFALWLLKEAFFVRHKIIGLCSGLSGLLVIFGNGLSLTPDRLPGFLAVSMAMVFQAFISVKLKQINVHISALETTTGALLVSVPLFGLMWWFSEGGIPPITIKAAISIGYLALFGSVMGFVSYYWLIKHTSVRVVGMIPLLTPVFALLLGSLLNDESLTSQQLSGILLVLAGLGYYEYGGKHGKSGG